MRVAALIAVALVALSLAACGDDDDDDNGGGEVQVETAQSTEPVSTAVDDFYANLDAGDTTSPTGALLDDPEVREIVRSVKERQSIAAELSALSPDYDVTPQEVASWEETACDLSGNLALEQIKLEIPGADLSALPALMRFETELALGCARNNRPWMDDFSGDVFSYLLSNTTSVPAPKPDPEPTATMTLIYKGGCAAIKQGIVQGLKRAFEHRGPAYGLSLAVGAMMTECPEYLDEQLGPLFD